jgi:hypothetical protein
MPMFEAEFARTLFQKGTWQPIEKLRSIAQRILRQTQSDPELAKIIRTQDRKTLAWAKPWAEEFYPLFSLDQHLRFAQDAEFCWTPDGAADFSIRARGELFGVQCTTAFAERAGSKGNQGGHVRKLEMMKCNEDGFCWRGGLVTEPRVRSELEDVEAWRSGISRSISRKLNPKYSGCWLLIFAPDCQFDTVDFNLEEVVRPAVDCAESESWESIFARLYVIDQPPPGGFVEIHARR